MVLKCWCWFGSSRLFTRGACGSVQRLEPRKVIDVGGPTVGENVMLDG